MTAMKSKNIISFCLALLLGGCAASMHPDYQPMYHKVIVPQEKIDSIKSQFDSQGLNEAFISRDAIGRLKLDGAYATESDVAKAFEIARAVAGANAVSPVTPTNIKRKNWEIVLTDGLAQFIENAAKKYNMAISTSVLDSNAESQDKSGSQKTPDNANVGLDTQVYDLGLNGISQFESGAIEPNANARQFYTEIAKKMAAEKLSSVDGKNKKILLIGHTDDVGDSQFNAKLSENRAHAIGQIFSNAGIEAANIFYQGAGETLPIADNVNVDGRAKNRRVELVIMADEQTFNAYLLNRLPNISFYRAVKPGNLKSKNNSADQGDSTLAAGNQKKNTTLSQKTSKDISKKIANEKLDTGLEKRTGVGRDLLDFNGEPINANNSKLNAGDFLVAKSSLSLFNDAHAASSRVGSCNYDRPRNAGLVKSLKDGTAYKNSDYLPGLYGRTWYDIAGNNLVVLNKVAVLRNGVVPANKPELKVYANYKAKGDSDLAIYMMPEVNTYQATNGVVYRVFVGGVKGMQCVDILMPSKNISLAKEGKVVYGGDELFVANFKPKKDD